MGESKTGNCAKLKTPQFRDQHGELEEEKKTLKERRARRELGNGMFNSTFEREWGS